MKKILVINIGATSSKIAVYEGLCEKIVKSVAHSGEVLQANKTTQEQIRFREDVVLRELEESGEDPSTFDAVISRGGPLKAVESGTYRIDTEVLKDAANPSVGGRHAACIGVLIAARLSDRYHYPAFIADPVSTDEMREEARLTGWKGIQRKSMFHALNQKAVARKAAKMLGKSYEEVNLIGVHMGGGTSIAAHEKGRVVDNYNIMDEGCFCMDRPGSLPNTDLIDLCYSGIMTKQELKAKIAKQSGVFSHLGTKDFLTMARMIESGDENALLVFRTMVYQHAKDIGAMAAAMKFQVDAIFFTGGIAYSNHMCSGLEEYVGKIAPILRIPGENEMASLASCALRVLEGEPAKEYGLAVDTE